MSPPVFIPRPETESLVIIASSLLNSQACKSLEIGPGTGAISLALLNRHEQVIKKIIVNSITVHCIQNLITLK